MQVLYGRLLKYLRYSFNKNEAEFFIKVLKMYFKNVEEAKVNGVDKPNKFIIPKGSFKSDIGMVNSATNYDIEYVFLKLYVPLTVMEDNDFITISIFDSIELLADVNAQNKEIYKIVFTFSHKFMELLNESFINFFKYLDMEGLMKFVHKYSYDFYALIGSNTLPFNESYKKAFVYKYIGIYSEKYANSVYDFITYVIKPMIKDFKKVNLAVDFTRKKDDFYFKVYVDKPKNKKSEESMTNKVNSESVAKESKVSYIPEKVDSVSQEEALSLLSDIGDDLDE